MKKIFILVAVMLTFVLQTIVFANANWKCVFTDDGGVYYLETTTVSPRIDDKGLYANIWAKQIPSIDFLDKFARNTSANNQEIYSLGEIVSHYEIRPSKWEYRVLKRIFYNKNYEVIHIDDEVSPWMKFKPQTAIDAIARESVAISIQESNKNKMCTF
jgi:hypothetical protein